MPAVSSRQYRAMQAAAHGHSTLGIPEKVGNEFADATPNPKALPPRVRKGAAKGSPRADVMRRRRGMEEGSPAEEAGESAAVERREDRRGR